MIRVLLFALALASANAAAAPQAPPSPAGAGVPVVMYSTSWCPYCAKARAYFKSNGIAFTEYDVEKSAPAKAEFTRLHALAAHQDQGHDVPDVAVHDVDASFTRYRLPLAKIDRLATGITRWAEGPVWFGDQRGLIWSDVPGDCMWRWDEMTGAVGPWRRPSGHANGNTRDRQGRLVTCEHGGRRVVRTEPGGSLTVLADRFEGKRLNSPNDVVCKTDGSIWFTDPSFGILGWYEGNKAEPEVPTHVYRIDPAGALSVVAEGINQPNGLAFSPDESILYIVESRSVPRKILAYDVVGGKSLANRRVLIDAGPKGTPDGFRVDVDGNLWCGWGMGEAGLDGVHVFNPDGRLIGRIELPERCANVCFGGLHRNRLFMAATTSLYALYVNTQGVAGG